MCYIEIKEINGEELNEIALWYNSIPIEDKDNLSFDFSTKNNSLTFFILKVDGILVGIMCAQIENLRVKFLSRFVAMVHRRKGYAEKLLDFMITKARNENKLSISGYIRTSRTSGIEFFRKKGFLVSDAAYDHTYKEHISEVKLNLR